MEIKLTRHQWCVLNVSDNYEFVRSAFFLGYGSTTIKTMLSDPRYKHQIDLTIQTAIHLGMHDEDRVVMIDESQEGGFDVKA